MWKKPLEAAEVIQEWESRSASFEIMKWLLQAILGGGVWRIEPASNFVLFQNN